MLGGRSFSFKQYKMPLDEVLSSFLLQYYAQAPVIPAEVLLPIELEEASVFAEILGEQRGGRVMVHWPQRGEKRALVNLAIRNAKSSFHEKRLEEQANKDVLDQVKRTLKLNATPFRIECYDISTIQGDKAVGAMVAFDGGVPNKTRYRRFSIRTVSGQDDFGMLREVLLRRFRRAIEENDLPDLVLIDGGKGQLNVAAAVFEDLGLDDLPAVAIAKSRVVGEGHSPERFFVPGRANPIVLSQHSSVVRFLARVRDEAHRFAITYHRAKRKRTALRSPLLEVPGVGPKRAKMLLNKVGSLVKIKESPVEAIASLPGMSERLAREIQQHLSAHR